MNLSILIAIIALVGSIGSTAFSVFGGPALQARHDASRVLEQYREPLLDASYELQARLHNILRCGFIEVYVNDDSSHKRRVALDTTLYVFAQFFGWREIIRRQISRLRFSEDGKTKQTAILLREISNEFLSDRYGTQSMIWRVEQRGIGEMMIVSIDNKVTCMGYASFLENRPKMSDWLDPLEHDLQHLNDKGRERLTVLQHSLLRLVKELDVEPARYSDPMSEA
jgi:hypothetical protein